MFRYFWHSPISIITLRWQPNDQVRPGLWLCHCHQRRAGHHHHPLIGARKGEIGDGGCDTDRWCQAATPSTEPEVWTCQESGLLEELAGQPPVWVVATYPRRLHVYFIKKGKQNNQLLSWRYQDRKVHGLTKTSNRTNTGIADYISKAQCDERRKH